MQCLQTCIVSEDNKLAAVDFFFRTAPSPETVIDVVGGSDSGGGEFDRRLSQLSVLLDIEV